MINIDLDIKVEFFKENNPSIEEVFKVDKVFQKTYMDIIEFMAYMGIERITLSGKTPEEDKKFRENLRTRNIEMDK